MVLMIVLMVVVMNQMKVEWCLFSLIGLIVNKIQVESSTTEWNGFDSREMEDSLFLSGGGVRISRRSLVQEPGLQPPRHRYPFERARKEFTTNGSMERNQSLVSSHRLVPWCTYPSTDTRSHPPHCAGSTLHH